MNPATRLIKILRQMKAKKSTAASKVVWRELFNLPNEDESDLQSFGLFNDLITLIFLVEKYVGELEDINKELFVRPINDLKSAFIAHNFSAQWNEFTGRITPEIITGLEFIEDSIRKNYNEEEIPSSELNGFKDQLLQLFNEIKDSGLDPELKTYALQVINRLLAAINNYDIFGAIGLSDAIAMGIGKTVMKAETIKAAKSEDRGVLNKMVSVMKTIGIAIKIVEGGKRLYFEFNNLITTIQKLTP